MVNNTQMIKLNDVKVFREHMERAKGKATEICLGFNNDVAHTATVLEVLYCVISKIEHDDDFALGMSFMLILQSYKDIATIRDKEKNETMFG